MIVPDGLELMINEVDLGKVIGITKTLAQKLSDTEELRKLLITGFPYAPFESVLKRLGWTRAQVGEALGLPERTLARRKQEGKFQPLESDRVFRFLQVVAHAIETIGDDEKAGRWLTKPNRALMGKVPLQLLNTPIGASQVDEILGRIDHGLYS